MSSLVILATSDAALAGVWERQLAPGRSALRLDQLAAVSPTAGFAAVVVLDASAESALPAALARCPTLYVGEPRSQPFEQARLARRGRVFLSYEESATRLGEYLPLLEEIAEKQSLVELLTERVHRTEAVPAPAAAGDSPAADWWSFLEGAVENLDSRERLIGEFRRAARLLLRAGQTVFFLREEGGFRADRGDEFVALDDPLVTFFERQPVLVDGTHWPGAADPVAELAVRNRLALWSARLLLPVHENGRLLGVIALGVRDDGQPYSVADHARGVFFARLLRHCLGKAGQLGRLHQLTEQARLGAKYLPGTLLLGPAEPPPRHVPLIVRELVGQSRRSAATVRQAPAPGQPYRVSAGAIAETGGTWAAWEEAGAEVREADVRQRAERRTLLRDLALTLSHEIGNTLVSLATFRQSTPEQPLPAALVQTAKTDVGKLEELNRELELMQAMHESDAQPADLRDLARGLGEVLGIGVQVGNEPVTLPVLPALLEFALRALIGAIAESRRELGASELTLQLRSTGVGANLTALFAIKGRPLELEGILPEPTPEAVPTQGRFGVFLAKEILRLHRGAIHAGPGLDGTEILLSLRGV